MTMNLEGFETEIKKTGFVLENQTAIQLRKAQWTVISNKYYVDDQEESVREIDLVAYKVTKIHHFDVYTVLIISCKKSEQDAWALLARPINLKDPNSDWWPLHAWSNDRALQYQLSQPGAAKRYQDAMNGRGVANVLNVPEVEVFAFQEMDKKSGKPHNDKNIFNAVTSLIKAQAYELTALPTRKKSPSVYQFNLLSVVDSELIRLMFDKGSIRASEIEAEHYLARYIVRKKEIFSRIRFIQSRAFEKALEDYGRLFSQNCVWFEEQLSDFYKDIEKSSDKMAVSSDDFIRQVKWPLRWRVRKILETDIEVIDTYFFWSKANESLTVNFNLSSEVVDFMNSDAECRQAIQKALAKVYRYPGPFTVTDLPF